MSVLGQKISRNVQQLGSKFKNVTQQLGNKAGEVLKSSDTVLRKVQNTLNNRVNPALAILDPSLIPAGIAGSAFIGGLRSQVKSAKDVANDLEKGNIRKLLESQQSQQNPASNFA